MSIGRLVAQKDYITILKALNLIKNKKYKLIIIGKGVDYIKLVSFIKKKLSKYVKILITKNVYPYYLKVDAFILSSLYEGLPNT